MIKKSDLLSLILDNADVIGEENIGGESRSMKKGRKKNETQE